MTAYLTDLIYGVAAILQAEATLANIVWRADNTPYQAGEVGVFVPVMDGSDTAVQIDTYPVSDPIGDSDSVVGVQFVIRAPSEAILNDLEADTFNAFNGRWGGKVGSAKLISAMRESGASLGQDAKGRLSRSYNYYFSVHRPTDIRT